MTKSGSFTPFSLARLDGERWEFSREVLENPLLLVFFETDCPTCRLMLPYLNRLAGALGEDNQGVVGISQDSLEETCQLVDQLSIGFPVLIDRTLNVSTLFDPDAVPALFIVQASGDISDSEIGFDKDRLNAMALFLTRAFGQQDIMIADPHDGAPLRQPGCSSRHHESQVEGIRAEPVDPYSKEGTPASRIILGEDTDLYHYCMDEGFSDFLPVIPPTLPRVERMLRATTLSSDEIIGRIPPCYGVATVEKIASNAVMAGCEPEMLSVLVALIRAACDERFNLHGVQATTHFAAPLITINGPIRHQLHFASGSNVFSNVARSNSTLGRALQLILLNLGGARPGEIDMSTLGNPGKFSYCISENEEASPWEPLHVELGFQPQQSTVTLFAAEPPRGVSEHTAREGKQILKTLSRTLVTIWSYWICARLEAFVVLCPEHVNTLHRDGFTKSDVREFLFENTGVPLRDFENNGSEGTQFQETYQEVIIDGEPNYLKFQKPEQIKILVAGGSAGKFSAVIGSWAAGPQGSEMVTYPVD